MSSTRTSIGVAIAVCGNICISVAINLQKLAHSKLQPSSSSTKPDPHPDESTPLVSSPLPSSASRSPNLLQNDGTTSQLSYLRSPLWWAGLVLMSAGEFCNFFSYGLSPASVVAPLGTVALISNCIVAPLLLGERFHKLDLLGVALAIAGTIAIVSSTPPGVEALNPDQLVDAISKTSFLAYVSLSLAAISLLQTLSKTEYFRRFIFIDVGTCSIFGGFTVLSTKALSSFLNQMFLNCFAYPVSWLVLFVLIFTALGQVVFLNRALQQFDSLHVVPVQFVLFTISTIIGSSILYEDFKQVNHAQALNFTYGCVTIFTGVYILTWAHDSSPPEDCVDTATPSPTTYRLPYPLITEVEEPQPQPQDRLYPGLSDRREFHSLSISPPPIGAGRHSGHAHTEIRKRRSQPVLFSTPGYYLIASTSVARNRNCIRTASVVTGTTRASANAELSRSLEG